MAKIRTPEEIENHKINMKKYMNSEKGKETRRKYEERNKEKTKEYQRVYRENNRERVSGYGKKSYPKHKEGKREYQRRLTAKYKTTFLEMYGNACSCCGESMYDFLTIEHRQGQEKASRRTGLVAYRDAVKEYRPDLYEVLCWNCNCAKGKLGYCPHHPPEAMKPYKIHKKDTYNYTKEIDSLGRRYGRTNIN